MHILVVTNMYPSEAAPASGVFVERQVRSLEREGLRVSVEEIAGSRGRADYLWARSRVGRAVKETGADLVHVHYGYSGLAGLGHGRPSVLTLHGSDLRRERSLPWRQRIGAEATRVLARFADRVLVQNESMKREFRGRMADRVQVLTNGIEETHFRPLPRDGARQRLGLPGEELVVLFVDAVRTRRKRRDLAEAAIAQIAAMGRPVRLLAVSKVKADEMPWYYAAADVLLMTSDYEGSPTCVKEALACGTPVVSVPVGDVQEVLDSPDRGLVVARDPDQLAQATVQVADRPRALESLLPQRLRADAIARQLIEVYQRVLEGRHR